MRMTTHCIVCITSRKPSQASAPLCTRIRKYAQVLAGISRSNTYTYLYWQLRILTSFCDYISVYLRMFTLLYTQLAPILCVIVLRVRRRSNMLLVRIKYASGAQEIITNVSLRLLRIITHLLRTVTHSYAIVYLHLRTSQFPSVNVRSGSVI